MPLAPGRPTAVPGVGRATVKWKTPVSNGATVKAYRVTTLVDGHGRRYVDGVSSLWCNVHGHRHPAIDAAVRAQLGTDRHDVPPLDRGDHRRLQITTPFSSKSGRKLFCR